MVYVAKYGFPGFYMSVQVILKQNYCGVVSHLLCNNGVFGATNSQYE